MKDFMITKTPHPHAEFLAEWLQDVNKKAEGKKRQGTRFDFWSEVTLEFVAASSEQWIFRFVDPAHKIVSSLSDRELYAIVLKHNPEHEDVNYSIVRAVANAAAAQHDADIAQKKSDDLKAVLRPQNFVDLDLISPEERLSLYKNTKHRIF